MLAQQEFALAVVHALFRLRIDFMRQAQDFDASCQQLQHLVEAMLQVAGFQHFLLLLHGEIENAGDEVGECSRRLDVLHCGRQIGRRLWQEFDDFGSALLQLQQARLDAGVFFFLLDDAFDAGDEERIAWQEFDSAKPFLALAHDIVAALLGRNVAQHAGGGADAVELFGRRRFEVGVVLQQQADLALAAHRFARGGNRRFAADGDRHDHAGKQHEVTHWNDGDRVRRNGRHGAGLFPDFLHRDRAVAFERDVEQLLVFHLVHAWSSCLVQSQVWTRGKEKAFQRKKRFRALVRGASGNTVGIPLGIHTSPSKRITSTSSPACTPCWS